MTWSLRSRRRGPITLNVELAQVYDLLEFVPRACVSYVDADGPHLAPTEVVPDGDGYRFSMSSSSEPRLSEGQEVVVIVDDGWQFFDLRAVYLRGHAHDPHTDVGSTGDVIWYHLRTSRTVAWDYSQIRETADDA